MRGRGGRGGDQGVGFCGIGVMRAGFERGGRGYGMRAGEGEKWSGRNE